MSILKTQSITDLRKFPNSIHQFGIVERSIPSKAQNFFKKFKALETFWCAGQVYKESASDDIQDILDEDITQEIKNDPFYQYWIEDMANISKLFCDIENSDCIGFWIGSERKCSRYHVDNVPLKLLVTYTGKGTEWITNCAADRDAFINGEPNEKILKDESAPKFINPWDVALFKGGEEGILHKTPDDSLETPSLMMRLDHESFWENVLKHSSK